LNRASTCVIDTDSSLFALRLFLKGIAMTLEQRLTVLERRCRLLSGALTGLLLIGGLIVMCGATDNERANSELRVSGLTIVDDQGHPRILIGKVRGDDFGLTILGGDRQQRVRLWNIKDAGAMQLLSKQSRVDAIAQPTSARFTVSRDGRFPNASIEADGNDARVELRRSGEDRTILPVDAKLTADPFGR
jgi:hypothetical protein